MSNEKRIFLGIDPGKEGFITLYDPQINDYEFYSMPYHKVPSGKKLVSGKDEMKQEFYPEGFRMLIIDLHKRCAGHRIIGAIEQVGGRQGWSAENNFNFGHTAGLQLMILIMLKAETEYVRPQKWQSFMYQGYQKVMVPSSTGKTMVNDTKATSALVAQAIEPTIDFTKTERSKVIHDGKTDSFLICLYSYRRFKE
jgi:hypothetical protein